MKNDLNELKAKIKKLENQPVLLYWNDINSHSFWSDYPQGMNPTECITFGYCVGLNERGDSIAIAGTLCDDKMWSDLNIIPLTLIKEIVPIKTNGEYGKLIKEWLE